MVAKVFDSLTKPRSDPPYWSGTARMDGALLRSAASAEVGLLPRTWLRPVYSWPNPGVRPYTLAPSATTIIDGIGLDVSKLHAPLQLPPYSTGEVRPLRGL